MESLDTKITLREAIFKTTQSFKASLPIMIGILLLINLINLFVEGYYPKLFTGSLILDPLIGALAGSISFGMPIVSYIVGGELLKNGISLVAISAFIISWSTIGIAMLPLEAKFLGKRFAVIRNIINFTFAIVVSILTVFTLALLS